MNIIIVLICISVVIAISFLGAFYWSIKSGQYEDTYTPSVRMLFEDSAKKSVDNNITSTEKKSPVEDQKNTLKQNKG
jgi:cbb3-type cytochrome oxidase maturation protein